MNTLSTVYYQPVGKYSNNRYFQQSKAHILSRIYLKSNAAIAKHLPDKVHYYGYYYMAHHEY
ncbi:hypothetical protein [Shewanella vesiculosa]|uniref:hypothetical protein n=1 Tax=Shewanella vesiculosa TaxID=518738 RepID=UPI00384CCA2E